MTDERDVEGVALAQVKIQRLEKHRDDMTRLPPVAPMADADDGHGQKGTSSSSWLGTGSMSMSRECSQGTGQILAQHRHVSRLVLDRHIGHEHQGARIMYQ